VIDDIIEEFVDRFEVGALDIPVELFEIQGKVYGCDYALLEGLGLIGGVVRFWEAHQWIPFVGFVEICLGIIGFR